MVFRGLPRACWEFSPYSSIANRSHVVFELEQVRDGQSQLLAVSRYPVLNHCSFLNDLDVEKPVL